MALKKHIKRTIKTLKFSSAKCGADAAFWPIPHKNWGLKFFNSQRMRDKNYERQAEAHSLGLGPALGNTMEVCIDGEYMYGFVTELATVYIDAFYKWNGIGENPPENCTISEYDRWYELCAGENGETPPEFEGKYQLLCNKIDSQSYYTRRDMYNDLHHANWGILKSGEPVIIDFSRYDRDSSY